MKLKDLAEIIYTEGTESASVPIVLMTYYGKGVLWKGRAENLKKWSGINNGWNVIEIRVDKDTTGEPSIIPDYNLGKIILVY